MGIKLFSSGSTSYCPDPTPITRETVTKPNPNPFRFTLKNIYNSEKFMMLIVNYDDATTYDGNKVLVYDRSHEEEVMKMLMDKDLDPHFLEDRLSPIARFPANDEGISLAFDLIGD